MFVQGSRERYNIAEKDLRMAKKTIHSMIPFATNANAATPGGGGQSRGISLPKIFGRRI